VKALLHSVYDQVNAAAAHAQFDGVADALTEELPHVAQQVTEPIRNREAQAPEPH